MSVLGLAALDPRSRAAGREEGHRPLCKALSVKDTILFPADANCEVNRECMGTLDCCWVIVSPAVGTPATLRAIRASMTMCLISTVSLHVVNYL